MEGTRVDRRRLEISNRLKAARQLAGYLAEDGRVKALPVKELVALPELAQNKITKNRIEDIEQMKDDARPMELKAIADALHLPTDWFARSGGEPLNQPIADLLQGVGAVARERRREREEPPGGSDVTSRPKTVGGGGA